MVPCKTPTACAQAVIALVEEFLGELSYSVDQLRRATEGSLVQARSRINMAVERLTTRPRIALERQVQRLTMHSASVRLLDPVTTMARGWSITRDENGNVVRSKDDVATGQKITTLLADGSITSTVEGIA
jgi:exodeoxyribonuclease VII large subunit